MISMTWLSPNLLTSSVLSPPPVGWLWRKFGNTKGRTQPPPRPHQTDSAGGPKTEVWMEPWRGWRTFCLPIRPGSQRWNLYYSWPSLSKDSCDDPIWILLLQRFTTFSWWLQTCTYRTYRSSTVLFSKMSVRGFFFSLHGWKKGSSWKAGIPGCWQESGLDLRFGFFFLQSFYTFLCGHTWKEEL